MAVGVNVAGLLLGIAGAVMLYRYPVLNEHAIWTEGYDEPGTKRLARCGLALVLVGVSLQFVAGLIS